jgi:hypothetical protein
MTLNANHEKVKHNRKYLKITKVIFHKKEEKKIPEALLTKAQKAGQS